MIQEKTTSSLFSASSENTASFRDRRQAGFTLIEILIAILIVAALSAGAMMAIRNALQNMRANEDMYRVISSLREARMLAMSTNRFVSVQFATNDNIKVLIRNTEDLDIWADTQWVSVNSMVPLGRDPSTTLENGHIFVAGSNSIGLSADDSSYTSTFEKNIALDALAARFTFTSDGILLRYDDDSAPPGFSTPINGTVFLGGGPENRLTRAVTILGATGRIDGWREKDGTWNKTR